MELILGYFIYLVFRLGGWLVPLLPLGISYRIAEIIGDLLYLLSYNVRKAILDNLECVLGKRDRKIARRIFRNLAKNYFDLFRVPELSREELEARLEIEGLEYLYKALAQGKGVILTSIHMGCPDVVGQLLAFYDIPVTVPVEPIKPRVLFEYISSLRARKGMRLIPVDGPLLELFRALRRGEAVGIVADRDVTESGQIMPFFGRPARLPDGAVRLARRTGAPIIMGFNIRKPDNTFKVWLEPPIYVPKKADDKIIRQVMRQIVATMEKYIRAYPDQWLVSVPVWQTDKGVRK